MTTPIAGSAGSSASAADQSQRDVPSTPSGNQGAPANPEPGKQEPTQPVANPEAQRYAQEAAQHRARVKELEAQLKTRDDATLTAQQKLERDYADTQAKALEHEAEVNRLRIENETYRLAGKLQVADIGAVIALVQAEHGSDITLDDRGRPSNLDKLIERVLRDHPALAAPAANGQPASGQRPGASSGGATNPGAGNRTGAFTRAQIAAMSDAEYAAHRTEIQAALQRNDIR